ncbi:hypothetical protein [Kocuria rhizophila]|uniref:Hypothetical membrane protein n=1 Tax=Kocuria rhizophila (strain ATCC 9341 / DSM 348 / NBRC 103217 / DC2201) TaxID=378753 RepID=B2GKY4_KOCRD|nr:hypothetical protein [Kocuria rhizophila]ASE11451.1 hypothetical protein CEP81_07195 [Kocuria rhizophila]MBK4120660.1 hypothetical protein [Kocuria rhizophila]BAG28521.1 hypothetical membrane protein [Kocuria rhizophila DC2201]VEH76175.1 ABC-type transport system involved in multi-copper enzyme maturation, permease component [Kocuria rhizophila]
MSTATTTTAPWGHAEPTGRGLSFLTLLRVELRKQVDTRAGRGLLIAIGVLTALALGLVTWLTREQGTDLPGLFVVTLTPQGLLLPVLGIITACNEWSQRTALITFTQEPRRLRVVLAKLLAALVLGTIALAAAWVLALIAHLISAGLSGSPVNIDLAPGQLAGQWLSQMLALLQGVAFGLALLSVPLAIVAYFVLPILYSAAALMVPALQDLGAWVSITAASAPLMEGVDLTATEWGQLGTSSLLWIGVPLLIGIWRVLTREVK